MSDKNYGQERIEQADVDERPETDATQEWVTKQIEVALKAERNRLADKFRRVAQLWENPKIKHLLYELADMI